MNRFLYFVCILFSMSSFAVAQTEEPMHYKITVPASAELILDGTLALPRNVKKAVPVVLLIAGSGPTDRDCNSGYGLRTNAFKMLSDSLVSRGIAVARYDKRGSGTNLAATAKALKSEDHRFDFYVSDAVGFIRQLQADKRFSDVIVAGHSEGSLVGMLAGRQTNVSKFISVSGPGRNIADVMKDQFRASTADTLRAVAATIIDSLRAGHTVRRVNPFLMSMFNAKTQPGLISWMKYDPAVEIKRFTGPVLIINGEHDIQVPASEARLLKAARPDAKLALFIQMNHILKDAPAERADNIKTYINPDLPLTAGLAATIADFVSH